MNQGFNRNRKIAQMCPCGKSNKDGKFCPFSDNPNFGYCHSCNQTFFDDSDNRDKELNAILKDNPVKQKKNYPNRIENSFVLNTLKRYEDNNFFLFLTGIFPRKEVLEAFNKYKVGTAKVRKGATIFWLIDINQEIRSGKIAVHDISTGKRDKQYNNWVHYLLYKNEYNLEHCFFGEHLLVDTTKTVCLVEAPKTAIIASLFMPQYIWIATGGKNAIKHKEQFNVLKDREVIVFPDTDSFEYWKKNLVTTLKPICKNVVINTFLQSETDNVLKATGLDLADYLLNLPKSEQNQKEDIVERIFPKERYIIIQDWQPYNVREIELEREEFNRYYFNASTEEVNAWNNRIKELKDWFSQNETIQDIIKNKKPYVLVNIYIPDMEVFLKDNFRHLGINKCNRFHEPRFTSLELLKKQIENEKIKQHI